MQGQAVRTVDVRTVEVAGHVSRDVVHAEVEEDNVVVAGEGHRSHGTEADPLQVQKQSSDDHKVRAQAVDSAGALLEVEAGVQIMQGPSDPTALM